MLDLEAISEILVLPGTADITADLDLLFCFALIAGLVAAFATTCGDLFVLVVALLLLGTTSGGDLAFFLIVLLLLILVEPILFLVGLKTKLDKI